VIYLHYMLAELRRRKGRTFLTALGLGFGVALVIVVSALSSGLDRAQQRVLAPLTGVGTDMSVTRPILVSGSGSSSSQQQAGPFGGLSEQEREELQKENGAGRRVDFGNLKAGSKFTRTSFNSTQVSFPASEVTNIAGLDGVAAAAGSLSLSMTTISGTVPKVTQAPQGGGFFRGGGGAGGAGGFNGPRGIDFASLAITGVDQSNDGVAAITSGQLTKGSWFSSDDTTKQVIVNQNYARSNKLTVGKTMKIRGGTYAVIGIVKTPVGGTSSDTYVKLAQLQKLSNRAGRVNTVYVRADSASHVDAVAKSIAGTLDGASVTTAKTLASQVTGSLKDAKSLTSKLGFVLELVALIGAVAIASLLTLSSVTKRVRELGTLKAIGWPQRLVVRQVTGESLLQGLLGGVVGIVLGIVAAALVGVFAPTLSATFASTAQSGFGFGGPPGARGAAPQSTSEAVQLTAHVSIGVVLAAVALALLGGLISGALGGFRASRLRPADALRHLD
jgi:ABC-type antimicrobial peptide transport system permease subunit